MLHRDWSWGKSIYIIKILGNFNTWVLHESIKLPSANIHIYYKIILLYQLAGHKSLQMETIRREWRRMERRKVQWLICSKFNYHIWFACHLDQWTHSRPSIWWSFAHAIFWYRWFLFKQDNIHFGIICAPSFTFSLMQILVLQLEDKYFLQISHCNIVSKPNSKTYVPRYLKWL